MSVDEPTVPEALMEISDALNRVAGNDRNPFGAEALGMAMIEASKSIENGLMLSGADMSGVANVISDGLSEIAEAIREHGKGAV